MLFEGEIIEILLFGQESFVCSITKYTIQIQPDDVEVITVTTSVHNGEVWIIRDVLK